MNDPIENLPFREFKAPPKKHKKRTAEEMNLSAARFSAKPTRFTELFVPACHSYNKVSIMLALYCRRYVTSKQYTMCMKLQHKTWKCTSFHAFQHISIQARLNKNKSVKLYVKNKQIMHESQSQSRRTVPQWQQRLLLIQH